MLRSQIVVLVLMLGFLGNWFAFLGVSIRNADSLPERCKLPRKSNDMLFECMAYMPSWYYDVETGQCELFIYGGCGGTANRSALSLYVLPWRISSQLANCKSLDPVESRLSIDDSAFSLQTPAESRTTFALLHQPLLKYLSILCNKLTCSSAVCEFWFFGFALQIP
ncbi:hypothetical protein lerEdw1_004461 [Lerista edwardsae]|nr:hypothetical protein lerEdw1_004461 [Lerista edwardsae]